MIKDLLTKKESEQKVDAFSSDFQRMRGQKDSSIRYNKGPVDKTSGGAVPMV